MASMVETMQEAKTVKMQPFIGEKQFGACPNCAAIIVSKKPELVKSAMANCKTCGSALCLEYIVQAFSEDNESNS